MPLALPIVVPFLTAILCLFAWRHPLVQRLLAVAGALALLAAGAVLIVQVSRQGIQSAQMGSWPAPYGITLVADHFSALMVLITGVIASTMAVYSLAGSEGEGRSFAFYPLLNAMLMGVTAALLTGDIFNLYVWFEVQLLASFVLMALEGNRPQIEGAVKYVALSLLASTLLLTAIGLLYGMVGTLNMAHLAVLLGETTHPRLVTTIGLLFLAALGVKAAIFPFFFWLPASYHTPAPVLSAVFAGLLTKVGVYALIRVFTLIFVHEPQVTHTLLLILAGLTMLVGVLGAIAQKEMRRLLSFHIVSQIGYMIMGLGLLTATALSGAVFFILHNIITKSNLFLVAGVVERMQGTSDLDRVGGFYRRSPGLSACFLFSAMSLAGVPPLSGFVGKLILVSAGLAEGQYVLVGVALAVSLLTLFSMVKIWSAVFWEEPPKESHDEAHTKDQAERRLSFAEKASLMGPTAVLAALAFALGAFGWPVLALTDAAAEELLHPERYIQQVLGDTGQDAP